MKSHLPISALYFWLLTLAAGSCAAYEFTIGGEIKDSGRQAAFHNDRTYSSLINDSGLDFRQTERRNEVNSQQCKTKETIVMNTPTKIRQMAFQLKAQITGWSTTTFRQARLVILARMEKSKTWRNSGFARDTSG